MSIILQDSWKIGFVINLRHIVLKKVANNIKYSDNTIILNALGVQARFKVGKYYKIR
ncbi:hypothetical protein [Methanobrevibacter sp. UBA188]|uniref:hypothetical protein n=1 Tax=Methanobrevibacter sp. UBA188 TaxID=1915473 RepID=UPI0025D15371|nr:hypothetical protein [Methanobrevibacter sp. UBA188]